MKLEITSDSTESQVQIPYYEYTFKINVKIKGVPTEAYILDDNTGGGKFYQITRRNGTITIHFDENDKDFTRSCSLKIINPLDMTDVTYFSFIQNVVALGISVFGDDNIEMLRRPHDVSRGGMSEMESDEDGCSVDKHGKPFQKLMTKIKVEGGSERCYIANIRKFEVVDEVNRTERKFEKEFKVAFELDEEYTTETYAIHKLIIENYGVPDSSKEYDYEITVAHNDDFTCTTIINASYTRIRLLPENEKYLYDNDEPVTTIEFDGSKNLSKVLDIKINGGSESGGYRWSIGGVIYPNNNRNWLSFEMCPTSVVVNCAYNNLQEERKCIVNFSINGVQHNLTVTQKGFDSFDIISSDEDGNIYTSATDLKDIKTVEVVGIGTPLKYNGKELQPEQEIDNLQYHVVKVASFTHFGNRYSYKLQIWPKERNNTTDEHTDELKLIAVSKNDLVKKFLLIQPAQGVGWLNKIQLIDKTYVSPVLTLKFICTSQSPTETESKSVPILTTLSSTWCETIGVDNVNGEVYIQVKENDKNVYGMPRRCKLIVFNSSDTSKACVFTLKNNEGNSLSVESETSTDSPSTDS